MTRVIASSSTRPHSLSSGSCSRRRRNLCGRFGGTPLLRIAACAHLEVVEHLEVVTDLTTLDGEVVPDHDAGGAGKEEQHKQNTQKKTTTHETKHNAQQHVAEH